MTRIALAVILFIFAATELLARAGGGDGFSGGGGFGGGGGGGSGFSGGGGSGDGFELIINLVYLCIRYPALGIPVTIIVIIFFIVSANKGNALRQDFVIRRVMQTQSQSDIIKNVKTILKEDPEFSEEKLLKRAENAFLKIQKAWKNRDMKDVSAFISDGINERFTTLIEIYKASGIKNCTEGAKVTSAELVALEADKFFHTAHVKIKATAIDYYIETGDQVRIVRGKTKPEPFTEIWTFLRRPGAKSRDEKGTIENFCPNCGTPLKISDSTICPSCKAVVNSGEYDWVLSSISQEYEWNYKSRYEIPGLNRLMEKDPAFNPAHIEDRASAIFYRYVAARFFADEGYLARLADNGFLKGHGAEFKPLANGRRRFPADASIGAAELLEVIPADKDGGQDKVVVKIKWSGHYEEKEVPSLIAPKFELSALYNHEFIFIRNPGVHSNAASGLTSIHCPNCGAPDTKAKSSTCEYCGTILNDGSRNWTLHDIVPFTGIPHPAMAFTRKPETGEIETTPLVNAARMVRGNREALVTYCAAMMKADNEISAIEMKELRKIAKEAGMTEERLVSIINSIDANTFSIQMPQDHQTAYALMRAMVIMCLIDGKISAGEKRLLSTAASKAGYSNVDIDMLVQKERLELLKMNRYSKDQAA